MLNFGIFWARNSPIKSQNNQKFQGGISLWLNIIHKIVKQVLSISTHPYLPVLTLGG